MPASTPASLPETTIPLLPSISLLALNTQLQAGLLVVAPAQLLVDCGRVVLPLLLGVCHFVTQLLRLRRRGTDIWLTNVHPGLNGSLHQFGLDALFHLDR